MTPEPDALPMRTETTLGVTRCTRVSTWSWIAFRSATLSGLFLAKTAGSFSVRALSSGALNSGCPASCAMALPARKMSDATVTAARKRKMYREIRFIGCTLDAASWVTWGSRVFVIIVGQRDFRQQEFCDFSARRAG